MLRNSRGNAMIEIVPILAIFILLVNFAMGFFGLIHSGILNSIGARNYAFETFRNRSDLRYIRDNNTGTNATFTYTKNQQRYHVIRSESSKDKDKFYATRRPIQFSDVNSFGDSGGDGEIGLQEHDAYKAIQETVRASETARVSEGTNNPWIRSAYGICLTATCGD